MIRRSLKNRREGKTAPEQLLGDMKKVYQFAEIYDQFQEDLEVIEAGWKMDYCNKGVFTSDEYRAFKTGVGVMSIFRECKAQAEIWKKADAESRAVALREAELQQGI